MTTKEEERVLRRLDPVPEDVNEWPDFTLTEVKIFYKGKGRYASLLEAGKDNPLSVVGVLAPLDDDQLDCALVDNYIEVLVKLEDVTRFSFGQDESGTPVVWAAGKAGWYEIIPSSRYESHYDKMVEAIDLFYFLVDQSQRPRQQRKGCTLSTFCNEYQKYTNYRVDENEEAIEILQKHHKFVMRQMYEGSQGVNWTETHIWLYLSESYPDVLAQLRDTEKEESEVEQSESESSEEEARDWSNVIWDVLCALRRPGINSQQSFTVRSLADHLRHHPEFTGNHQAAVEAIRASAKTLLAFMLQSKLRKKYNWLRKPIYAELEAFVVPDAESDNEVKTPAKKLKQHRQKSVLRPSGHGGKARKRTRVDAEFSGDEESEDRPASSSDVDSPVHKRSQVPNIPGVQSSVQMNGTFPPLPPLLQESEDMLALVEKEAKAAGLLHKISHLKEYLGDWNG